MSDVPLDWQAPRAFTSTGDRTAEDRILGWCKEAAEQGENFLKAQRSYGDIDKALDLIAGLDSDRRPKSLSKVRVAKVKRGIREIVATESNIRPLWGYHSDNKNLENHAEVLNKILRAWHYNTFFDLALSDVQKWAAVACRGYISPVWEKDLWTKGRGDIATKVYGPKDVLPVQIGRDHNLQRAYCVTGRVETPIAQAFAQFPTFAHLLKPSRAKASWLRRGMQAMEKYLSPALNVAGKIQRKEAEAGSFPTIDINYSYIIDGSINTSGHKIPMGKPGTSWYYEVPSINDDIPTGIRDVHGNELVRKATEEDAMLYPFRRLIIWADGALLSDDTSPWWHGMAPYVPFGFDEWPWDFLGYSLAHDAAPLEQSMNNAMRAIDDSANVRLRPPLQYDRNVITKSFMDRFDPRQSGQNVGVDLQMGEPVKPIMPPGYYDVPQWMLEYIKGNSEMIDYLMGVRDITAMMKAKQVPAFDTFEKLEQAGPIVVELGRSMERSLRLYGEMMKSMFFQFYQVGRLIEMRGEEAQLEELYDYEPGNLIPSHMPGEDKQKESSYSLIQRAKFHQNSFFFQIVPNTVHNVTQMTKRLFLLQLYMRGFPIDPWTIAQASDLPDFGPEPEGTKNIIERWVAWMHMKKELGEELGGQPSGVGQPTGRKPSGQSPPRQGMKGDGRPYIRESK